MEAAAKKRGVDLIKPRKGSHYKFSEPGSGGKTYPVPAHNGIRTDISDMYVRGLCRCFGWDYDQFKADL